MNVAPSRQKAQQAPSANHASSSPSLPNLLTDKEAAARFQLDASTLRSWRCRGIGPVYTKLGPGKHAPVRYSVADLEDFIAEGRHSIASKAASTGRQTSRSADAVTS